VQIEQLEEILISDINTIYVELKWPLYDFIKNENNCYYSKQIKEFVKIITNKDDINNDNYYKFNEIILSILKKNNNYK
jgi:hypothetical protein